MSETILDVRGLRTAFHTEAGAYPAVDGVSFTLQRGEILGLVGESGSGKSVTGFSVMGLIDSPGEIAAGEIKFKGKDLLKLDEEGMRQLRGNRIAMIFQDPLMTLNPVLRIGEQMAEAILTHEAVSKAQAMERCAEALGLVGIPSPKARLRSFPHEFSGGMRQRVAIAIAMLNNPDLIIADEPTTALDVTIQGQILYRMQEICRTRDTALIWITHDLGVVAELADHIAVMYAGRIVEAGPVAQVLDAPRHPYTRGLLQSMPGKALPGGRLQQINGMAPSLAARPWGCPFRPRCPNAVTRCTEQFPGATHEGARVFHCYSPVTHGGSQAVAQAGAGAGSQPGSQPIAQPGSHTGPQA